MILQPDKLQSKPIKKLPLNGLALAFQNLRPGRSHYSAITMAWLGLACLGSAWISSWPQARPRLEPWMQGRMDHVKRVGAWQHKHSKKHFLPLTEPPGRRFHACDSEELPCHLYKILLMSDWTNYKELFRLYSPHWCSLCPSDHVNPLNERHNSVIVVNGKKVSQ